MYAKRHLFDYENYKKINNGNKKNSNVSLLRICGHSGGETFTKKNIGPTNVMIVRFDSALYDAVRPGKGFTLTATAAPSGKTYNHLKHLLIRFNYNNKRNHNEIQYFKTHLT